MSKKTKYRIFLAIAVVGGILLGKDRFDPPGPAMPAQSEELSSPDRTRAADLRWMGVAEGSTPAVGHLVRTAGGGATFRSCGAESMPVEIADPEGLLMNPRFESVPTTGTAREAFVSLMLARETESGSDPASAGPATVTGINYWPVEGFGCDYPWEDFGFRAFGNEPFWMLEVTNGVASLSRPDNQVRTWRVETGRLPLLSEDRSLEVRIVMAPCLDDMSGSTYGAQVSVTSEGAFLKGCGMLGLGRLRR